MRIAIISQTFFPDIGGIATISRAMAEVIASQGHQVEIFTRSQGADDVGTTSQVHRRMSPIAALPLLRQCDFILQNHISLWGIAAHFLTGKRSVVWLQAQVGPSEPTWINHLMIALFRAYIRISPRVAAISQPVALDFGNLPVTGNAYNAELFRSSDSPHRPFSLLFCGRVETFKGTHLFMEVLPILFRNYPDITATIAGTGAQLEEIKAMADSFVIKDRIHFAGATNPQETAALMQTHEILVVPSIWEEPFGVVAVEGIASGCYVVGFRDGGLPEAIGSAGVIAPRKTGESLAESIAEIWRSPALRQEIDNARAAHLANFTPDEIWKKLLSILDKTAK